MTKPQMIEAPILVVRRSEAIQAYSALEFHLAMTVHDLMNVDATLALSLIQRMTNTRSRYALIDDLVIQSPCNEIRPFWKALTKRLSILDGTRNNIVHWNMLNTEKDGATHYFLAPWKTFTGNSDARIEIDDIDTFLKDCQEVGSLISLFISYLRSDKKTRDALRDIFLQPIDDRTLEVLTKTVHALATKQHPHQSSPE